MFAIFYRRLSSLPERAFHLYHELSFLSRKMCNSYPGTMSRKVDKDVGALVIVISAKAGIQTPRYFLDSGSRPRRGLGRNDVKK